MRVFLIGFMGCGKTTVGRKFANKLNLDFYDLDILIEKKYNTTISEIFEREGEASFRIKEHIVLSEISSSDSFVLSTGGGTPCYHNNLAFMNSNGITVYLRMPPSALFVRLVKSKTERPLIKYFDEDELKIFIENKIKEREPFYLKSKIVVNAVNININALLGLIGI